MRSARVGALLGAVALLATGCAQEDDAHHLLPVDAAGSPAEAADEALAASTLLTVDDFPSGWRTQPVPPDAGELDPAAGAQLARCLGTDSETVDTDFPHASTPTFVSPAGDAVTVRVTLAPDDGWPRAAVQHLRQTEAPGCYAQLMEDAIRSSQPVEDAPADVEYGTPTAVVIPYADFGDTTVALRTSLPVSAGGEHINVYVDSVVVRVDRALVSFSFNTQIRPYDRDESERVVQKQVERVSEALAEDA